MVKYHHSGTALLLLLFSVSFATRVGATATFCISARAGGVVANNDLAELWLRK
jgi:hypothetical protein